jgi:hypothetical protein
MAKAARESTKASQSAESKGLGNLDLSTLNRDDLLQLHAGAMKGRHDLPLVASRRLDHQPHSATERPDQGGTAVQRVGEAAIEASLAAGQVKERLKNLRPLA